MAHELGHAIGLEHEHQRPDARTYLDMNYRNFKQYGDCARDLQEYPEDPNFGVGWGVNLPYLQKMDMMCVRFVTCISISPLTMGQNKKREISQKILPRDKTFYASRRQPSCDLRV